MDIMAEAMGAALADDLDISDSDDEDGGGGANNDQGSEIISTELVKKVGPRLCELTFATRGSQPGCRIMLPMNPILTIHSHFQLSIQCRR